MPSFGGDFDDGAAGDAFEDAGGRAAACRSAVADDEDVVAGAFGHFALVVEHQPFLGAGLQRLDLRQDVVEVVERL